MLRPKSKTCHSDRINSYSQAKNADDIVITLAIRTPLTKAKKGGFKDTSLEYLVYALLTQVRERSGLDPALVEDICLGNVSFHNTILLSSPGRVHSGKEDKLTICRSQMARLRISSERPH